MYFFLFRLFMPLRPVSNVVPLPCRTKLIEFGTAVARRWKPFSSATWIKFDTVIKFDRVCRATRQWHGSVSNVPLLPCRTQFIKYEMYILSVLTLLSLTATFCFFWIWCDWIKFDVWNHSRAIAVPLPCNSRVKFIWVRHGSSATFETGLMNHNP